VVFFIHPKNGKNHPVRKQGRLQADPFPVVHPTDAGIFGMKTGVFPLSFYNCHHQL
jgi:hypothetical protein